MKRLSNLQIWGEARALVRSVYAATQGLRDADVRDQVRRSAASVLANISEGAGRHTDADFRRFLAIALGSCHETIAHLALASDCLLLPDTTCAPLITDADPRTPHRRAHAPAATAVTAHGGVEVLRALVQVRGESPRSVRSGATAPFASASPGRQPRSASASPGREPRSASAGPGREPRSGGAGPGARAPGGRSGQSPRTAIPRGGLRRRAGTSLVERSETRRRSRRRQTLTAASGCGDAQHRSAASAESASGAGAARAALHR